MFVTVGCARPAAAPRADACAACDELDAPARPAREPDVPEPPARTLSFESGVPGGAHDRWAVRRIGAGAADQARARPPRVKPVDIEVVRANFEEVARLLSDVGRFNVVVQATSAAPVTARLKRVEPFDALLVLAETRGLSVRFSSGIVIIDDGSTKDPPSALRE